MAQAFTSSMPLILCCICGASIHNNPSNMCVSCLRNTCDITDGISRQLTIHSCRGCSRFLCPPWQKLELESKELMAMCLRKIPGLNKVKLIDAVWIWTEPHSMRIKIKITVQKEVTNGAILQQAAVIEFVIRNQQCKDCEISYTESGWHAVVQVRQRVSHKRTFFYLEQLLLKHNAHTDCLKIMTYKDGMDFYFMERQQAMRFVDFLSNHVPIRTSLSRKLVSADHKSNKANYKNNYMVEIVPICKDDLLVLPKELASNLSDISPLVLVKSIGSEIHVVDPLTGERNEVNTEKYWRHEFVATMNSRQLVRFIVLSVEPMLNNPRPSSKKRGVDRKIRLAEVVIAKESDFGVTDTQYTCITHLGNILHEGDTVLGYDLSSASSWIENEDHSKKLKANFPDILLVRKHYPTKGERFWALRNLDTAEDEMQLTNKEKSAMDEDYEEFLQEIEGDKEMRTNINLYKSKNIATKKNKKEDGNMDENEDDYENNNGDEDDMDEGEEGIRLDELLDDMALQESAEDELPAVILSSEEAAAIPRLVVPTSGFDLADVNMKDFKFK